jgi:LPXTG-site transpeptidase (sortase) family protein
VLSLVVLAAASWLLGMGVGFAGVGTLKSRTVPVTPVATNTPVRAYQAPTPTTATAPVTAEADATRSDAAPGGRIARVRMPTIGVDAPVVVKGLDAQRRMEAPDRPDEVAWYDFTALPGEGSNVVLAGHVDFAGVGPAVFWDLWRVSIGDPIELVLVDGRVLRYRVSGMETVEEARAPVERIVGPTATERLTVITCAGNYNPATGRYDQRLIVIAEPLGSTR